MGFISYLFNLAEMDTTQPFLRVSLEAEKVSSTCRFQTVLYRYGTKYAYSPPNCNVYFASRVDGDS